MKKIVVVLVLITALSVGVFAQHPSGWGVGVMGQYNLAWDGFGGGGGAALSLKAPQLPIYWGLNLDIRSHTFGFSVTGDYYIIDNPILSDINLGWYLGLGGYVGLAHYSYKSTDWNSFRFGARLPVGIYILPVKFLEVFLDVAPSLGVGIYTGDYDDHFHFPEGGLGFDLGVRFWF